MKKTLYLLDDPGKDKHVHKYVLDGLVEAGFEPTIGYFYGDPDESVMTGPGIRAFSLGLDKKDFKGSEKFGVKAVTPQEFMKKRGM